MKKFQDMAKKILLHDKKYHKPKNGDNTMTHHSSFSTHTSVKKQRKKNNIYS